MKNMLCMPIELEPASDNCFENACDTKAPVIPGHSQHITALLNGCIKDIGNIDQKNIQNIVKYLFDLGLARDFVIEVWQKRYYGNIGLGKALTLSYTCGRCTNTNGLFVVVNGPAGFGKSAGMKTMLDLMPPEYVKQGKESAHVFAGPNLTPRADPILTPWTTNLTHRV